MVQIEVCLLPVSLEKLPLPTVDAQNISSCLLQRIRDEIIASGELSFARYMELVLYTPGLGYYSAGAQKFGSRGDFITAPEVSPLFGKCLAKQASEVLIYLSEADVLEFGAGSGCLAVDVLRGLAELNALPRHYYILELSASLKARQQVLIRENLAEFSDRVIWLDQLPQQFSGVILANEVLDAMPVRRFYQDKTELKESWIGWDGTLVEHFGNVSNVVRETLANSGINFTDGYTSEINLLASPWINALADILKMGLILLIDYGFPRREYYHPQRYMGTLRCHYRHHAHDDFFFYPGLQDITAHVDFTQVAQSAVMAGLQLAGYTTQAHFLMSCGLMDMAAQIEPATIQAYHTNQDIKKLLLPSEMGELFKVMALTRGITMPLCGFSLQDMRHKL